ncbi:hypothetical protein GCM10010411_74040 [Actinomadura fulvescens]|uniref:Uncharacterized protein n=2 Tax=Actinomadura fulvescens TaxID=46160 RepID=A0ABN3QGZ5_9ACTN
MHPVQIPGYDGGPFTHRPELLDEPLFWLGHLASCAHDEETDELLFGADYEAASDCQRRVWEPADWPVFTIPLATGARFHIVYRTLKADPGIDYLLHHPSWEQAELLAQDDGHFMGPALSWPELLAAADNSPSGGSISDPHARLLLLLPSFGDAAVPNSEPSAVERPTKALRDRTRVKEPRKLAVALLGGQGQWGPAPWTTTSTGVRVNTGSLSPRNPTTDFALPLPRMARVAKALAP